MLLPRAFLQSWIDHLKKLRNFQISLKNEDLFHNIPEELKDLQSIFEEIENLEFEERPNYEKVITFIKNHEHFGKAEWLTLYTRKLLHCVTYYSLFQKVHYFNLYKMSPVRMITLLTKITRLLLIISYYSSENTISSFWSINMICEKVELYN